MYEKKIHVLFIVVNNFLPQIQYELCDKLFHIEQKMFKNL